MVITMNNADVKINRTLRLILNFWENKIKIKTPTNSEIYEPLEKVKNKLTNDMNNKNELSLSPIIDLVILSADKTL